MSARLPKIKCFKCGAWLKAALKAIKLASSHARGVGQVRLYTGVCDSCGAEVEYCVDFRANPPLKKKALDLGAKKRDAGRKLKAQLG